MGALSVCLSVGACVLSVCNVGILWSHGWMDQNETWHGGRPRPWPHCVRWGPSSPSHKGAQPPIVGHVCCGQTAGCIKMALGMEVGLGPGHIVLDGKAAPAPPPKKRCTVPCLLWMNQDATWYGDRPRPRRHCVRRRTQLPLKWGTVPHFSAHVYCGQTVAHLNHC